MAVVVPPQVYPVTLFVELVSFAFERAGSPPLRVSSWWRSFGAQEELIDLGTGALRSLHTRGLALDLQGSASARQAMGSAWRALGLDAIDEGPAASRVNPVLHIELDGPVLRRLGVDFR